MKAVAAALAAAALLATPVPALAGGDDARALLDAAAAAIEEVDYQEARQRVDRALTTGRLTPGQLVRAHRLMGEITAALDQPDAAREHFLRWILLDTGADLPSGMSPKITEPFAAARREAARLGGFELTVRLRRTPGAVEVTADARDPRRWIRAMRARLAGGDEVTLRDGSGELEVDDAEAVEVEVVAVDERGNQLAIASASAGPREAGKAPPPRRRGLPAALRWPTWAGLAVVAAGSGAYFGWRVGQAEDDLRALNADSMQHSFDDARAIQDRGRRDALIANISIGVAAAAALAAVLTYTLEPRGVEVRPEAGSDRVGAIASVRF